MKKAFLILSIVVLVLGTSCSKDDNDSKEIYVRVENTSSIEYYEVVLEMNADNIFDYRSIKPGEKTEYRKFNFASNMPNALIDIDRKAYKFLYNDDLGYTEFDSGYYTFKISTYDIGNNEISLYFEITTD